MTDRKLIYVAGAWRIAKRVPAKSYGSAGPDVWSDPESTAYICRVGEEAKVADLPTAP